MYGYALAVAGISGILYIVLIIRKISNTTANLKLQEFLFVGVALLQFSYAVVIAITQSQLVDPNGPNGATARTFSIPPSIKKPTPTCSQSNWPILLFSG
jgi:hypothetical protein